MSTINQIISSLNLQPHPEGGYYKETYRSSETCDVHYSNSKRSYSTGIYFLLTQNNFSAFHRIKQDEMWHFYKGKPIVVHMINPKGDYSHVVLGNDFENNQVPQFVVPAGYWFASEVLDNKEYGLVGCTVAPGFDFEDFELPNRAALIDLFPQHKIIITRLTR